MPIPEKPPYGKLFLTTLKISALAFGGGFVVFPMLRRKFIDEYKWIDPDDMYDLMAIGQCTPGTIAGNTTMLVGYRVAGFWGAVLTMFSMMIPPLIILTILTAFYAAFRDHPLLLNLMAGMQAGVGAVILDIVYGMAKEVLEKDKSIIILLLFVIGFAGVFFLGISPIYLILFGAAVGILLCAYRRAKEGKQP